ncbi:MAG: hypothetical protein M3O86_00130 [Actinomycetota bacterium]|jgi:plasmid stability protein|nr:hypothetical protein [Actinomycetota bacterium]
MAHLQIKNLPDDVHAELRRRAQLRGASVREYVLDLIRRDQLLPSMTEWLDAAATAEPVTLDARAYALLDEDRRQRHGEGVAETPANA